LGVGWHEINGSPPNVFGADKPRSRRAHSGHSCYLSSILTASPFVAETDSELEYTGVANVRRKCEPRIPALAPVGGPCGISKRPQGDFTIGAGASDVRREASQQPGDSLLTEPPFAYIQYPTGNTTQAKVRPCCLWGAAPARTAPPRQWHLRVNMYRIDRARKPLTGPIRVLGCIPVGPTCRLGPTRYQGRSQDLTIGGAKRQCQLKIYEHNLLVVDIVIGRNKHLFIKCRSSTFTTRHIEHVN
jgi:hypothetical protein